MLACQYSCSGMRFGLRVPALRCSVFQSPLDCRGERLHVRSPEEMMMAPRTVDAVDVDATP